MFERRVITAEDVIRVLNLGKPEDGTYSSRLTGMFRISEEMLRAEPLLSARYAIRHIREVLLREIKQMDQELDNLEYQFPKFERKECVEE